MKEIWLGNDLFKMYFEISAPYVGNVSGHYILAILRLFLPARIAEKILLSLYVVLLATGFRYLVKGISKTINFSYLLIFPFTYTFLLMMGFYNYSLAFGFLFFALGYYIRHQDNLRLDKLLILSILVLFTYYSHVFVYGFLLMAIGILFINFHVSTYIKERSFDFRYFFIRLSKVLIAIMPSLILAGFYINLILQHPAGKSALGMFDRWEFLTQMKILVGFVGLEEIPYTQKFFWLLLSLTALSILSIIIRVFNRNFSYVNSNYNQELVWALLVLVFFALYFFMPNNLNAAGNVLNRILIMALYFLLIWLSIKKMPFIVNFVILLFIAYNSFSIYRIHIKHRQHYDKVITEIKAIEQHIPENSVFLSKNYLEGWVTYHFQTYIGTDSPILNIYSQAISPLFVVKWSETMPQTFVGTNFSHDYTGVSNIPDVSGTVLTDYITIVGKEEFIKGNDDKPLMEAISQYYKEVEDVDNSLVALYKLNIRDEIEEVKSNLSGNQRTIKRLQIKSSETGVPLEDLIMREALWNIKIKRSED
ncbi:MAG: hypothetical protein M0Q90_12350 [Bacteroidales bacterium]|nr:hypothetical protein [Bacteroidales bacterium]